MARHWMSYDSVEDAIKAWTECLLPVLRVRKQMADTGALPLRHELYKNVCRVIAFLENPKKLRKAFKKSLQPNGRVERIFESEAESPFPQNFDEEYVKFTEGTE